MVLKKDFYKDGDIIGIKLVNGDEVVCKVVETTEHFLTVSKPLTVLPSQHGIGLVQTLFSMDSDKIVEIGTNHIMIKFPVDTRIRDHYIQTTTGIQPVTNESMLVTAK